MKQIAPLLALAACSLAGCMQTAAAPLDQVPAETITLSGNYAALANCAYARLDKSAGTGIKKVDLQNESRLALESGGVRYWELTLTADGPKATKVAFTQVQTLWGPMKADDVMPTVRACAGA